MRSSPRLHGVLTEPNNQVFVSAGAVSEIAIKARVGKLSPRPQSQGFAAAIERQGFLPPPITLERAGALPPHPADPFDRMLVAQAQAEKQHLVSSDRTLEQVRRGAGVVIGPERALRPPSRVTSAGSATHLPAT